MTQHTAVVIGGACAGSEIASALRELGLSVAVIDQNALPYGKIEDGLPAWHDKLRAKEMNAIDQRLNQDGIHFIPNCSLGKDLFLKQLQDEWGVHLIIIAVGAWRDRPLRIEGLDQVTDDSFVYQNPFVYWFNHYQEPHYSGTHYFVKPGAVVIGGGLASIDVAKICQFERCAQAIRTKGGTPNFVHMDHYGIDRTLEEHGLSRDDIPGEPAKLFYRKRVEDMPLVPLGDNPAPEKLEKATKVRRKIVNNAITRYGFEVHHLRAPEKVEVENGSIKAVIFRINRFENGRIVDSGERERVETNQIISSIGSIPAPIADIPMTGELYDIKDPFTASLEGYDRVYCVGNAVTGRGNIKESAKHAKRLGSLMAGCFTDDEVDYACIFNTQREEARRHVDRMLEDLRNTPKPSKEALDHFHAKIREMQQKAGYAGDYDQWREKVLGSR